MVLDGIATISGSTQGIGGLSHDVSRAFGGRGNTGDIIFGVIELIAGALLVISRFASLGALDGILRVAILIFWLVYIVLSLILGGNINAIDTLGWWTTLVNHLIILVILWMIKD